MINNLSLLESRSWYVPWLRAGWTTQRKLLSLRFEHHVRRQDAKHVLSAPCPNRAATEANSAERTLQRVSNAADLALCIASHAEIVV